MSKTIENTLGRLQGLRGMPDLLPENIHLWQEIEETARQHFKRCSISEIRTPLLEATELFSRGIGEGTDVVGKEMYSFNDRGERSCTLRPEGTASIVRASIQHGLLKKGVQRFWYYGPMFRYERPQTGRQRQFHQIGLELFGPIDPRSDVEAIAIAWDYLSDLGLTKQIKLEINSLGNKEDRSKHRLMLINWLEQNRNHLDKDSQKRIRNNPLRILDSKNPQTRQLLVNAPLLIDYMSSESLHRFEEVRNGLTKLNIPFHENPYLVRGLDYYTHTAFEITSNQLGSQATICGGGRYDNLVKELGGPPTPAIGWAIGMERLVFLLSQQPHSQNEKHPEFYVVSRGELAEREALSISRNLRLKNHSVEIDLSKANFSKQLKRADKSGARWAIIIGENEAKGGKVILKDLRVETEKVSKEENIDINTLLIRFD